MAVYAAYHRNRWNGLTHFIGVPAIIFAILIPMSWVSLGEDLSLAHLFLGAVLAYYFLLDVVGSGSACSSPEAGSSSS